VVGSEEREEARLGKSDKKEDLSAGRMCGVGVAGSGLKEDTRRAGVTNGRDLPGRKIC